MTDSRSLTVVDLFGGAGGTGLGFLDAGFTILAAVDTDPHAAETYYQNLGVEVAQRDIMKLSPGWLRRRLGLQRGELDVLAGCPPCQGFTRLRNDTGSKDPRNKLVMRYLRFVSEFQPRFAVFENVSGMLDTRHGQSFHARLIRGFRRRGYTVKEQVLQAADFGVPQFRQRVIIIAARQGYGIRIPSPTHGCPTDPAVVEGLRRPWVTVREVIGGGSFPPLAAGQSNERRGMLPNHRAGKTGAKVCAFLKRVPRNGGSRSQVPKKYLLPCHKDHTGHADTYSRLAWDSPANTITTGCTNPSKGRFVHPTQTRALSYREAATLQGFPVEYRFHRQNIDRQIGNAVPPPLALAIAEALKASLLARRGSRPDVAAAPRVAHSRNHARAASQMQAAPRTSRRPLSKPPRRSGRRSPAPRGTPVQLRRAA